MCLVAYCATGAFRLRFWRKQPQSGYGFAVNPGVIANVLYTDASGHGWGGLVQLVWRVTSRVEEPAHAVASH